MQVRFLARRVARRVSERLLLAHKRFPFAANVVLLSGGASLGHGFTLAAAPILTRLYVPSDVGTLGLFTAFLGVAVVVASLQYDVAIVSAGTEREAAYLVKLSLICAIPMSAGCGILIHEMSRRSLLGFGALPWYAAWLMVASILFAALFSTLRYWSLRNEEFGTVSQGLLFQNAGRSLAQVVLGAIGFHALGLLLGETIGRAIGMGRMVRITWPVVRQYPLRGGGPVAALVRHRQFPIYSAPSSLLNLLGTSLPLPLLVTLYGPEAGGYYSLVWRVLAVPVVLIGTGMADAFHSQAALYARNDPKRLLRFFHNSTMGLVAIGVIPAAAIAVFGQSIFVFVFGAQWKLSGAIAAIVAPWFLTSFVVSPLSRLVYVLHGQRLKLIYDVAVLGGNLGVFAVADRNGWALLHMVVAMSVMNTASRIIYYFVLLRIATTGCRLSRETLPPNLAESSTT